MYTGIVRPIVEYAAPVWNFSLAVAESDDIDSIQRRAMEIIYGYDSHYDVSSENAKLPYLVDRRTKQYFQLFSKVCKNDRVLHALLPNESS